MRTRVVLYQPIRGITANGLQAQSEAPARAVLDTPSDATLIDPV
jgi:hypothetical protein